MKYLTSCLVLLAGLFASGSPAVAEPPSATPAAHPETKPTLTTFDLDFPGGAPRELVAAIERAQRRPFNAIVPTEYDQWKLPPLKMSHVTVADLFGALGQMAVTREYAMGNGTTTVANIAASFRTTDHPPTDDSVWYFQFSGSPIRDTSATRYYRLAPYLEAGMTVDDITTAIQTGWKMSGLPNVPKLSFHKETKLLIAVGEQNALAGIDNVLRALEPNLKNKEPASEKPEKKP